MLRLFKILWVCYKYRLDQCLPIGTMPWYVRFLCLSFCLVKPPELSLSERLASALEELGPLFVKFGQLLSTRPDLLSDDATNELAKLQDNVAPFDSERSVAIIEEALGAPVGHLFHTFDSIPMASASIAQVHAATLFDLREVVVKVVRPNIRKLIDKDLKLLKVGAWLIYRLHPDGKRLRPMEVVEEYHYTLINELDLKKEAANASQLRRNFITSDLLYVPEIYWPYCRKNVMVMERIDGISVSDIAALDAQGSDRKKLAERGVEIFFTQVFKHSFFHADMHPGNIFVAKTPVDPPKYIAIDCAIVGSLDEADQYYVARCLLAIFKRDYRLVAKLHVESGWVAKGTKVTEFESAIRSVCEPIFERPLAEISFAELLLYLFQTARRFDMQVQPSLMLLQKTLLHIEGLGREVYPDLDLWETAMPFLENWMRARYSPLNIFKQVEQHLPSWLEHLPDMPDLVYDNLHAQKTNDQATLLSLFKQQQRVNHWLSLGFITLAAVLLIKLL